MEQFVSFTDKLGLRLALAVMLAAVLAFAAPASAAKLRPDLAVASVTAPSSVAAGATFDASDAVRNKGKKAARKSKVTYSLSTSGSSSGDGAVILGTRTVPKLKPRKRSSGSVSLTVPAAAKPGDYFLFACAGGKFREKSMRNNCKAAPGPLTVVGRQPRGASLSIDPASGALASTLIGGVSPPRSFTVTNVGDSPSGPISSQFGSAPFSSVPAADGCTGRTLAPGAGCTFGIVFAPTQRGAAQSQVSISAVPGGTVNAPVSGTGLAPANLSISDSSGPDPVSWNFGPTVIGSDASPHSYSITNGGDVATGALTAEFTGGGSNDFALAGGTCLGGTTLGAGLTCTVIANFHPLTSGPKEAALEVAGAPGGSVSTAVTGNGQTPPSLSLSPILHNYGGVPFNGSSDFAFTIINTGQASSSAISLSISGTNASSFALLSVGDTCSGQSLGSGVSCSFTVRFRPGTTGAKTAFVSFSAAAGGAGSARLDGTGT